MIAPQRRQNQNQACTCGFIVGAAHSPNMYPRTPIDSGAPRPRMLVVGKPSSGTTLPPRRQARRRRQSPRRIPPCRGQGGSSSSIGASSSLGVSSSAWYRCSACLLLAFSSSATYRAGLVVPPRPVRYVAPSSRVYSR